MKLALIVWLSHVTIRNSRPRPRADRCPRRGCFRADLKPKAKTPLAGGAKKKVPAGGKKKKGGKKTKKV